MIDRSAYSVKTNKRMSLLSDETDVKRMDLFKSGREH